MNTVRSFTAFDLVRLPRLDAKNSHSLARATLAAAEGQPLSEGAKEASEDVTIAADSLLELIKLKTSGGAVESGLGTREADARLDAAWSAAFDFFTAWSKLRDEPKARIAAEIRERLFPDGLKFTKIQFTRQWTESEWRLSLLGEGSVGASIDALGGRTFVESIQRAHKDYGDVLGLSKALEDPVEEEGIRDAVSKLMGALRTYVLQVSAMARKSDPSSQALVDKLLSPIIHWQSSAVGKGGPAQAPPEAPAEVVEAGEAGETEGGCG